MDNQNNVKLKRVLGFNLRRGAVFHAVFAFATITTIAGIAAIVAIGHKDITDLHNLHYEWSFQ